MIISNQKNPIKIKIRDSILIKVSTVKFLGVTLDENLTFNDQVKNVTTKISKSVGVMRRLHCQLPADVMVKLYYSMVYSHLTYALLPCLSALTGKVKWRAERPIIFFNLSLCIF